jgi:hydroxyacid-oxoacid transhydrogenase
VLIWLAIVLGVNLGHDLMYGPQAAYFSELFGTRVRYSGASLGYQLASVFAGGFAPLIAVALLAAGGDEPTLVALYMAGMALITVIATAFARETYREDVPEVDRPTADRTLRARVRARDHRGVVTNETVFTLEATPIKFGPGASADAGWELRRLGARRVMLVSDPGVVAAGITDRVRESIEAAGIEVVVFDRARVEPTAESMQEAADFAIDGGFDGFVGAGGGSSIDTAKVADLVATHPAPIMDYVNAPVGEGRKPPGPLKPLLAIPTTAGTGAEATTVAILDIPEQRTKSGISHRYLRPHQGIVDPELLRGLPAEVTSSCGLDVVCHAVESFVSKPYDSRAKPESPDDRPPYQGANPVSDVWSAKALEYGGRFLRRAVADPDALEARGHMMLAASLAGIGFGSAGVHIPHACAYPIASLKHEFRPPGYPDDHPFVPHGWSVIVTAPAAFRFTYEADPDKHRRAAELLTGREIPDADANTLPDVLIDLMRDVGAPSGVRALGYDEDDVSDLVGGAVKQQRLLVISPREVGEEELAAIIGESMENWATTDSPRAAVGG